MQVEELEGEMKMAVATLFLVLITGESCFATHRKLLEETDGQSLAAAGADAAAPDQQNGTPEEGQLERASDVSIRHRMDMNTFNACFNACLKMNPKNPAGGDNN